MSWVCCVARVPGSDRENPIRAEEIISIAAHGGMTLKHLKAVAACRERQRSPRREESSN